MCRILYVSVSGYYKYRRNLDKTDKDTVLSAAIQFILGKSPYNDNYGVPRMQLAFLQKGLTAGIRGITRIMREHGWIHKPHRRPKGLMHVTTEIQEQKNLTKQDFSASHPLKSCERISRRFHARMENYIFLRFWIVITERFFL